MRAGKIVYHHYRLGRPVDATSIKKYPKSLGVDLTRVIQMLCISTRERVLHTPFAGRNQFFDSKTTFTLLTEQNKGKPHKNMQ